MDTAPLAAEASLILQGNENSFQKGLDVLSQLTSGKVRLSFKPEDKVFADFKNCELHNFSGKHPAGNVGVHIHHISPIKNANDIVWSCYVQAVILIGRLFETGKINSEIIVKVAGSAVKKRYYYKTIIGAEVSSFLGKVDENSRIISGDVLTGKKIEQDGFVGFKDNLITVIPEATKPEFLGWLNPGFSKRSWWKTFVSAIITPKKTFKADTNIGGGNRSLVINSIYEEVVPMNILPSYLIKSILAEECSIDPCIHFWDFQCRLSAFFIDRPHCFSLGYNSERCNNCYTDLSNSSCYRRGLGSAVCSYQKA